MAPLSQLPVRTGVTEWCSGREFVPQHIGEYEASRMKVSGFLRWWNGKHWSAVYISSMSDATKQRRRRTPSTLTNEDIFFRGLIHKPKVHSILYLQPLTNIP